MNDEHRPQDDLTILGVAPSDKRRLESMGFTTPEQIALLSPYELQRLPQLYNQWVKLARLHKPELKVSQQKFEAYIDELNGLITRYYGAPLRRDLRMADYAKRIPSSMARAEFSDITDATLEAALDLVKRSIEECRET